MTVEQRLLNKANKEAEAPTTEPTLPEEPNHFKNLAAKMQNFGRANFMSRTPGVITKARADFGKNCTALYGRLLRVDPIRALYVWNTNVRAPYQPYHVTRHLRKDYKRLADAVRVFGVDPFTWDYREEKKATEKPTTI